MKRSLFPSSQTIFRALSLLCLMMMIAGPQTVLANNQHDFNHAAFTLEDLGYTSDDQYQGVLVSHEYNVTFPVTWAYQGPLNITINFSHSASLNSHSSMAVDWNAVRVGSALLTPQNAGDGSLVVQVPASAVAAGYNKLSIQFYMGIRDDFCEDFDNPAIWAVVHNSTSFGVDYSTQTPELNLHTLPETLIDPSPLQKSTISLVLPSKPSIAELDAAALVSAKLGQMADWREAKLQTISFDQLSVQKPAGNLVFISTASRLADIDTTRLSMLDSTRVALLEITQQLGLSGNGSSVQMKNTDGSAISPDSGVLLLEKSPYDPSAMMLTVTGISEAGLKKAGRAFGTTSIYDRLSGPLGVILDTPTAKEPDTKPSLIYSFDSLGFKDIVSTGSRQQSSYITFPLQLVFDSQDEATLHLIFSHSTALNADRSSLDILVNNVPVTSFTLNEQNAQNAKVDIKIPLRLFKLGDNTITLTSNLQVNRGATLSTLYCTDKYYSDSWLTISPESNIYFPTGIGQNTASMVRYPNLYLGSANFSNLAFVVPEQVDWPTTNLVLQLANTLGHTARGDSLLSEVVPASKQASISTERPYQIIVGLPAQNAAIMQINDLLPQPFNADKVTPKPLPEMAQISSPSGALGFIESLFTKDGQYRLVLTGTSAKSLDWMSNILTTPKLYKKFSGNLIVVSNAEETAFLTISSKTSLVSERPVSTPVAPSSAEKGVNQYPTWVIWLAGGIVILSLAILLGIRLLQNRKKS
jgi:cellulose synthase operon protein B